MNVVEDMRKVLQDFLAPERRAVDARFAAMENIRDARFNEVMSRIDGVGPRLDARLDATNARMDATNERIDGLEKLP